jgi:hypothetical protein
MLVWSLVLASGAGCAQTAPRPDVAYREPPPAEPAAVDCVLPAQVRKLGSQLVYLGPRRTIKTSPRECELRGGTFTAATIGTPTPSGR